MNLNSNAKDGLYGGALYIDGASTVNVTNTKFDGNRAINGGAAYVASGGVLTISGSTFSNNSANQVSSISYGGAIMVGRSGTLNVSSTSFISNRAGTDAATTGRGGAIAINTGLGSNVASVPTATATINNVTFSNNTATTSGRHLSGDEATGQGAFVVSQSTFSGTGAGAQDITQRTSGELDFTISNSGNPSLLNVNASSLVNSTPATSTPTVIAPEWSGVCNALSCTNENFPPVIITCATAPTLTATASCQVTIPNLVSQIKASDDCSFTVTQSPAAGTIITATTVASTQTITFTVTDANGNTTTCSVVVTIPACVASCAASISGTMSVCPGSTSTLTASSGSSYIWSTGEATASITKGAGTYTVTVTDSNGCTSSDFKTITEYSVTAASISGGTEVCPGSTSTLTASSGSSYIWSTGEATASVTKGAGTYRVTVTDANGCTSAAFKTITQYSVSAASISGTTSVCSGSTSILTASSGSSYIWSTGEATASVTKGAGTYTVTVTDSNGCTSSAFKTITEYSVSAASISGTTSVCPGSTSTLTASSGSSYIWSTGEATASVTKGAGTYTVTVTDSNGCISSAFKTITEYNAVSISGTTSVCPSSTSTLTASSGSSYIWSTGEATASITKGAGTYTVTVTDSNGCTSSASKTITEYSVTAASISGTTSVCPGSTSTLTASSGSSYTWSTGEATASVTKGAGTYMVTVTDANGCQSAASKTITEYSVTAGLTSSNDITCAQSSSTLTATGGGTYLWENNLTTSTRTVAVAGTYQVTITSISGCFVVKSATVSENKTVPSAPNVTVTQPSCTVSTGAVSILNPVSGMEYSYDNGATWTTSTSSSLATGSYLVKARSTSNGCSSSSTNAVINAAPTIPNAPTIIAARNSICAGSSTKLTATGCMGLVTWSNGQTGPEISVSNAGTYTAVCTSNGCTSTNSNSITLQINALPTITITGATTGCSGSTLRLTANGGTVYSWSNSMITNWIDVSAVNGIYTVLGTDANGCENEASVTITALPNPTATIAGAISFCSTSSSVLTASGGGTYKWSTNATTAAINVTAAGTYTVTVTSANGCTAVKSVQVSTYSCPPPCPTSSNLLLNGSFELPALSRTNDVIIQQNWTNLVDGGVIETWRNGFLSVPPVNGVQIIELNAYQLGTIVQNVTVQTGVPITLAYSHRSRNAAGQRLRVEIRNPATNTVIHSYTSTSNLGWTRFSTTFSTTVPNIQIRFVSLDVCTGDAGCGNLMDHVVMNYTNCICSPVPSQPTITATTTTVSNTTSSTLTATACAGGTIRWSNGQTGPSITTNVPGEYYAQCIIGTCESQPSNRITITSTTDVATTCPTFQWRTNGVFHVNFCIRNNGASPASGIAYVKVGGSLVYEEYYTNLAPGASKCFTYRKRFIPCGSTFTAEVGVTVIGTDTNPSNNTCTGSAKMNCTPNPPPYDPNYKDVTPKRNMEGGIFVGDEWLTYKVHCQNDGLGRAVDVVMVDTIDITKLNINTLEVISSSHPMRMVRRGTNVVAFEFHNVQLASSHNDLAGSQAEVTFKIKRLSIDVAIQPVGTTISNKVEIYFDHEPAVATNYADSKVIDPCPLTSIMPGVVTPNQNVIDASAPLSPFVLSDYEGVIMRWESSPLSTFFDGTVTKYAEYSNTFNYLGALNAEFFVRAVVQTGSCAEAPSTSAFVSFGPISLPVTWLEFTARKANKNDGLLDWSTATEKNNRGFEVQHSLDAIHFENVGFVQGNGTTQQQHNYQFVHKNLASGTHYYRLRQVDNDGNSEFSGVRSLNIGTAATERTFNIYPNPNSGKFTITGSEALGKIKLYDALGQLIYTNTVNDKVHSISLENLADGAYLIIVGDQSKKVIIKK